MSSAKIYYYREYKILLIAYPNLTVNSKETTYYNSEQYY